jgi:hypothetical protein
MTLLQARQGGWPPHRAVAGGRAGFAIGQYF